MHDSVLWSGIGFEFTFLRVLEVSLDYLWLLELSFGFVRSSLIVVSILLSFFNDGVNLVNVHVWDVWAHLSI